MATRPSRPCRSFGGNRDRRRGVREPGPPSSGRSQDDLFSEDRALREVAEGLSGSGPDPQIEPLLVDLDPPPGAPPLGRHPEAGPLVDLRKDTNLLAACPIRVFFNTPLRLGLQPGLHPFDILPDQVGDGQFVGAPLQARAAPGAVSGRFDGFLDPPVLQTSGTVPLHQ